MDNKVYDTWTELSEIVNDGQEDLTRFMHGNKSAGTRLRKRMQRIKQLAQQVRVEVQERKNSVMA